MEENYAWWMSDTRWREEQSIGHSHIHDYHIRIALDVFGVPYMQINTISVQMFDIVDALASAWTGSEIL